MTNYNYYEHKSSAEFYQSYEELREKDDYIVDNGECIYWYNCAGCLLASLELETNIYREF